MMVAVLFALQPYLSGQNPMDLFNADIDTSYITTFPNALMLKGFINGKILFLDVQDQKDDYELNYAPNGNNSLGFGFNYKWIGFSMGFKTLDENDKSIYGETGYFDFQTSFILRKGFINVYFQEYQGFYLENSASMINNWPSQDVYLIRPDIEVFSSGIDYTHIVKPEKFSYIASFSQTEVQRKSAGSVILGGSLNYHRVSADSSFVPSGLIYEDAFNNNQVTDIRGITTNARFGYAHTLVALERFFLSLSLDAGMAYVYSTYNESGGKQKHNFQVNPIASFKMAAGYNYNRWYLGLTAASFYHENKSADVENVMRIGYGFVNFILAHRFMLKKEIWLPKF
jgi:hypothetical protein